MISRVLLVLLPVTAFLENEFRFVFDAVLLGIIAYVVVSRRLMPVVPGRFVFWIAGFVVCSLISYSIGLWNDLLLTPQQGLPTLARTLELFLLPIAVATLISHDSNDRLLGKSLAVSTLTAIFWGAFLISDAFLSGTNGTPLTRQAERWAGTIAVVAPILTAVLLCSRARLAVPLSIVCLIFALLSGSRAAFAGGVLGLFFLLVVTLPEGIRRSSVVILATAALALYLLSSPAAQSGITAVMTGTVSSSEFGRIGGWQKTVEEFLQSPLVGHGLGVEYRFFYEGEWARLIYETGAIGLFFALGIAASIAAQLNEHLRSIDPVRRILAAGLLGSLIVLLLRSLFGSPNLRAADGGIFLIFLSLFLIRPKALVFHPDERETFQNDRRSVVPTPFPPPEAL